MKITAEKLRQIKACPTCVDRFLKAFPSGEATVDQIVKLMIERKPVYEDWNFFIAKMKPAGPAEAKTYYYDGKLRYTIPYLDGKRHGTTIEWYPDGTTIKRVTTYDNGHPHGTSYRAHQNGEKWIENTYSHGIFHGVQREWHDNGQLAREATYENGNLVKSEELDEDGILIEDKLP